MLQILYLEWIVYYNIYCDLKVLKELCNSCSFVQFCDITLIRRENTNYSQKKDCVMLCITSNVALPRIHKKKKEIINKNR
jgi:hypothetical protein